MESKRIINLSHIAFFIWIVYFAMMFIRGNVNFNIQVTFSYAMVAYMLAYKLIKQEGFTELPFNFHSLTVWYGAFFVWVVITGFWTPGYIVTNGNTPPEQMIRIVTVLMAMDFYVSQKEDVQNLIKALCIGATIFAAYTIVTSPVSSYGTLNYGATTGQQRNTTGYILCFTTYFLIYLYVEYKDKYWLLFAAVCFVASLLTGSRKIIFAYAFSVLLIIIGQKSFKFTLKYLFIILVAAAIIIPIAYQIPYIQEAFGERLLAVLDDSIEDSSIMFRTVAKYNAIRIFTERPILGNGWAAVKNSFSFNGVSIYAHNNYLEVAADFGIIGCFFYYIKSAVYAIKCFPRIKKGKSYMTASVLLASMLLLDWGQVTYIYLYMIFIWGIVYKYIQYECLSVEEEKI